MKKTDNNNVIFRASWFNTLERWSPEMIKELMSILHAYSKNEDVVITNERILDFWDNARPLLDSDRQKYTKKVEVARINGKSGGAPEGNKNALKNNQEQPKTTENNQEQPTRLNNNRKQAIDIDIDIDIDNDIDIETDIETETETDIETDKNKVELKSYMFIQEKPSKEDIELFDIMFVDFNEKDDVYDNLFDMWIKLPFNEQDDSVKYAENYIKYQKNKKEIPSLFFYLKDKKYNWTTLRK
jgi:hypothetical protein